MRAARLIAQDYAVVKFTTTENSTKGSGIAASRTEDQKCRLGQAISSMVGPPPSLVRRPGMCLYVIRPTSDHARGPAVQLEGELQ